MKCDKIRNLFPDEWAGALSAGARTQLDDHLAGCSSCREERDHLMGLWRRLGQLPLAEPGARVRARFHAMLDGYEQGSRQSQPARAPRNPLRERFGSWGVRQPVFQLGFAAVLLVFGFLAGYLFRTNGDRQAELADLRQEVRGMRQMVTMSLLKQQSASERLKGVSWSRQVTHPDPEFLETLLHTLNYDPSVDVRLAAVDALYRFSADAAVRQGLIQSLRRQDSPLVQISLIDLLVQLHERQSIEVLKQLTRDPDQNEVVRQRAQWGLQKLS